MDGWEGERERSPPYTLHLVASCIGALRLIHSLDVLALKLIHQVL